MKDYSAGSYVRMTKEELSGLKWIFFDVGTVLADEEPVHQKRFGMIKSRIRELTGRDMTYAEYSAIMDDCGSRMEHGAFGSAAARLGLHGIPPYFPELEQPMPGAPEAVRRLAGKYRLGIIANQMKELPERLDRLGYAGCFEPGVIFGSSDCGMKKPDPEIFAAALAAAGCLPRDALMVGDRPDNDIGPAHRTGMFTARILTGSYRGSVPRDRDEEADVSVGSVAELAAILV